MDYSMIGMVIFGSVGLVAFLIRATRQSADRFEAMTPEQRAEDFDARII